MIKLEGTDKLMAAIKQALLKHKVEDVRKALKRGAMILVDKAKSNVQNSVTGVLKNSIKILPKFRGAPSALYVGPRVKRRKRGKGEVGKITDSPFYAHWVEYGTSAHNLGFKGRFVEVKGRDHPGAKPKPYMRPAFDTAGQQALIQAMEDIGKMIMNNVR